ncbi:hypothetical protein O181_048066 [Austropuccinia psidii MF-1]|uniref:Uncharacterized protein n=1 Tax=Austropuccinia psidii MF-1 TaxID=1389203 RepID=A0A9Q3DPZ8_9BASI|nr:hypothetical protein [Austropuccinia psidii MF-1]
MVNEIILKKCGGELENAIRSRCIDPFSTEDFINSMEDITTRKEIGRNYYKPPIDIKISGKTIQRPNKPQDRAPFKVHKCKSTSHLANTCPKKKKINEIEIEKTEDTKERNVVTVHGTDYETLKKEKSQMNLV